MAAKPLPEQVRALVGKLLAAMPFLKRKLPGRERRAEPFDTIEDEGGGALDDFGPNVAPDAPKAAAKAAAGKGAADRRAEGAEALKGFLETVLRNKLALVLIFAFLALILAICVVAIVVTAPPRAGSELERTTSEGVVMLRRLPRPEVPGIEARVELEREKDRVYTAEDARPFMTDPASIDISRLEARNRDEIDSLYRTVP
jgi:hypothetical protein